MTSFASALTKEIAPTCPQCRKPAHCAYKGVRDAWHLDDKEYHFARCESCRSLFIVPAPTDEELAKSYAYAEYYTHAQSERQQRRSLIRGCLHRINLDTFRVAFGYGSGSLLANTLAKFGWVRRRCGQSMRYLRWKHDGTLLEVGCGDGEFLREAHRWGWKCWGLEPDKQAASHRLAEEDIQVLCGRIEDLDHYGLTFDAIVLHHVIEHVRDPKEALRILAAHVRAGGQIVSISPNPEAIGLTLAGKFWPGLDPPRHVLIPSISLLLQICDAVGLQGRGFCLYRNFKSAVLPSVGSRTGRQLGWLWRVGLSGVELLLGLTLGTLQIPRGDEIVLIAEGR